MNHPRWARPIFILYALLLAFATHKPDLTFDVGPIPRPDIFVHIAAFAIWTVLIARCGFFGPWRSGRNLLLSGLVAAAYSAIDEATQAIPGINRQARVDDGLANVGGVAVGLLALALVTRARSADNHDRTLDPAGVSTENHPPDEPKAPNGR